MLLFIVHKKFCFRISFLILVIMVLVSHRYKFIYIKTIKTAGTSVEDYFQRYCLPEDQQDMYISHHESTQTIKNSGIIGSRRSGRRDGDKWYSHVPAIQVKKMLGVRTWRSYFKFTVIRNPWDKVVSLYHHKYGPNPKLSFRDFVKGQVKRSVDWHIYTIKKEPRCNFYIRFEHLEEDIERVCEILRITFNKNRLRHYKKSRRLEDNYRDYYDEETKEIVRKAYLREINYFKFTF